MNKDQLTSVVALNNFMSKLHGEPIYILAKVGKSQPPSFKYRCVAMGDEVFGTGGTKREAKRVAAHKMLEQLSLRGYKVPPEFASPQAINELRDLAGLPTHSFVVLVSNLCQKYRLGPVTYEVLADPAGQQCFTVKIRIGYVERVATAASRRIAYQLAAELMHKHLREWLKETNDLNEEEAMINAYMRAMAQIGEEQRASFLGEQARRQEQEQAAAQSQTYEPSVAMHAAVHMELDQPEHSGQMSYAVGPASPRPGPSNAPEHYGNNAQAADEAVQHVALQLLQLNMKRHGN